MNAYAARVAFWWRWGKGGGKPGLVAFDDGPSTIALTFNSPKIASKAALITFPNRNRLSSCQDWREIVICCHQEHLSLSALSFTKLPYPVILISKHHRLLHKPETPVTPSCSASLTSQNPPNIPVTSQISGFEVLFWITM